MYDIFICSLDGKKLKINVEDDTTVYEKKNKLYKLNNIIPERQKMIYCGSVLGNNETMKSANIILYTNIHIVYQDEYEYWKGLRISKKTTIIPNIKRGKQISYVKLSYLKKMLKSIKTSFYVNTILLQHNLSGDTILYSNENNKITYLTDQPTSVYKYLCLENPLYTIN